MGQSNPHQPLNPLPEENQPGPGTAGFVDSGMQTGDGNGTGPDGSPAGGGSHRHHRRRRRKQQQQQQQQQRTTAEMGNNGSGLNDQGDGATGDGSQFGEAHSNPQLDEQRQPFDQDVAAPRRHHSISAGTYSDADPNSTQQSFNMSNDASRPGYMRFGYFLVFPLQLPPRTGNVTFGLPYVMLTLELLRH
ncbi:unnamed protein product [Echinostoma caproni]|uniref:CTNNB1_binding domain-containing protein n=1 Tax=Echinostoma caproni TaxID=27848 RepID=A0A183B911_9TREM|nr:unnamed protein product [Echinostoma caproni]